MAWSTRQIADLAGTTVKAIRHYHATGLLKEPLRAANGYKQYATEHLVRLLQIRQLRELGMSTAEIRETVDSDGTFLDAVRALDDRLAASIERQQGIRAELAELLAHPTGPNVPVGFASVADGLTDADRSVISVSGLLYEEQGMRDLHEIVERHQDADSAFNDLPADAPADAIRSVAAGLAVVLRRIHEDFPDTRTLPRPTGVHEQEAQHALVTAVTELYNPAQLAVLAEAYRLARQDSPADASEGGAGG